jgi:hypothetical protein
VTVSGRLLPSLPIRDLVPCGVAWRTCSCWSKRRDSFA